MLIRHATLTLFIAVFGAVPAWRDAQKMNYLGQIIDMTELIPPPPLRDSEAQKQDLLGVMEVQESRTEAQVRSAIADNILSIYRFETCLDQSSNVKICRVMDAFMEKAQADAARHPDRRQERPAAAASGGGQQGGPRARRHPAAADRLSQWRCRLHHAHRHRAVEDGPREALRAVRTQP